MKPARFVVAAMLCLILFASPAFAASPGDHSKGTSSQPLSLTMQGLITNAGDQHYELGGGQLVQGVVEGNPLSPGQVDLSMFASVHGLKANGGGSLQVSAGHGDGSAPFSMQFSITGMVPAAIFPITPVSNSFVNCDPSSQHCNSEIPLLFTGMAIVHAGKGSAPIRLPIAIESPYWNPFGGPILITSLDSATAPSIFLIVAYGSATIDWSGVQLQGGMAGTLGSEPVAGSYAQVSYSQENLFSGKEHDTGSIVFAGMSDPTLNAHGLFVGHTSFSLAGSFDCAPLFGLPEGTCTATGASSGGSFQMVGSQGAHIVGSYSTVWSVPSLFTQTTVLGAVTQP